MKQIFSILLVLALVSGVAGSLVSGTMGSFSDTEVSTQNEMHAGTRTLWLSGSPVSVEHAVPSKWYSQEYLLVATGTLNSVAYVHIMNLVSKEAGTINGQVYYKATNTYGAGSPVGAGVATSEAESVAEEGGQVGNIIVSGLGVDAGDDSGPSAMIMSKHVDAKIWFDKDNDGVFDPDELIAADKLFNIACQDIQLGPIPGVPQTSTGKGGGWGTYFQYTIDSGTLELPLLIGQNWPAGIVRVWNDATNLYVEYDNSQSGWKMKETHVYVGTAPPAKLAPGFFPYAHEDLPNVTHDLYVIPLKPTWTGVLYIAAHASNSETGWGTGQYCKFKIEIHIQQIQDVLWPRDYDGDSGSDADDARLSWWPTDALQGDTCTFDMEFKVVTP